MTEDTSELTFSFLSVLSTDKVAKVNEKAQKPAGKKKTFNQSQIKIILIGEGAVGKTALRLKFMGEESTHGLYISTLGADFSLKYIDIEDQSIMLQIWDIAGQSRFKDIISSYYEGANGALVVYDLTRMQTFEEVKYWIDHLYSITGPIPFCILGNKLDIAPTNQIFQDVLTEADYKIKELNDVLKKDFGFEIHHFLTSAYTGEHVEEAYTLLTKEVLEYLKKMQVKITET